MLTDFLLKLSIPTAEIAGDSGGKKSNEFLISKLIIVTYDSFHLPMTMAMAMAMAVLGP